MEITYNEVIKCLQRTIPYVNSFGKCSLSLEIEEIITLLKEEKEKGCLLQTKSKNGI